MEQTEIIHEAEKMIREKFLAEGSGHDWFHIWRVWQLAKKIAIEERANLFIVELGALLHDISDYKVTGDPLSGGIASKEWLSKFKLEENIVNQVVHIVNNVSFKGAGVGDKMESLEGKVVQDADRLDAIGAIGIGRVFAYGGNKGIPMHDPNIPPVNASDFESFKQGWKTTVNHFYEALFLLKDRIHTNTGKRLAEGRHKYLESYLEEFLVEWDGSR